MRMIVYPCLDAHVHHCVLAGMHVQGKLLFNKRLPTSEAALIGHIVAVDTRRKELVLETFSLAGWLAPALQDTVDAFIESDPCQNVLISRAQEKPGGCLQPAPTAAAG